MNTSAELLLQRAKERVFRQKEHRHIVSWADEFFWLPPASSNNKDLIRWKTHPYQRFILHASADLDTFMTVVIKPTQVGLSKCALIGLAYESVHRNRSNGIWLPTRGDANQFSNVQIADMLEHVPEVREALKVDFNKKDKDNTTKRRHFRGSQSYCQGTQTLQDVSSISVEHVFGDEVSKYARQLKGGKDDKGKDPVEGMKGRLDSAIDPCMTLMSTPTEYGVCQISREHSKCRENFERGFFCPECNCWHVFEWADEKTKHGFKWEKKYFADGTPDDMESARTVYYQCPECDHKHRYEDLPELDENGEWRSARLRFDEDLYKYFDLETGEEAPSPYSVGIQVRGWFNRRKAWWRGALAFLEAVRGLSEGDPEKMVDWIQDYKAEAYRPPESSSYVKHGWLMSRRYGSQEAPISDHIQMITKDWDVQADRAEELTVGWGPRFECWLIDHKVYWGDPKTSNVLKNVQKNTKQTYKKENGYEMPVFLTGIDSKYLPDTVNAYCTGEWKFKIIPHMGSTSLGKPIVQGRTAASKNYGTFLTTICPDSGKDQVYEMYRVEEPGPGYVHIPEDGPFAEESLIKQMVAEVKKLVKGVMRWWCGDHVRNEMLDLMVGNLAIMLLAQQKFGFEFVTKEEYKLVDPQEEEAGEVTIEDLIKLANA